MSVTTVDAPLKREAEKERTNYLTMSPIRVESWLLTVDHKRIAMMYLMALSRRLLPPRRPCGGI